MKEKKPGSSNIKTSRCFNCGVAGHLSKDCKNKDRGTKCFRCNDFGHIATKCKSEKVSSNSSSETGVNFFASEKGDLEEQK